MQAIRVREFGGPEALRLEEAPEPLPHGDDVLVRVHAAGVNPIDTYIRSGDYNRLPALPYTPGMDGAGIVVETGQRVYLSGSTTGTYASFALCRPEQLRPLPDGLTFAQGASLGTPYATAYRALFQRGKAMSGETVLVHGASGGVGLALVQFAVAAGLRVVGSVGSEGGGELVAGQGDVKVVDHREPDHLRTAVGLTDDRGFDLIIELRADLNLGADLTALAPRGRVVVVGSRGAVDVNPRDLMNVDGTVLAMLLFNATSSELEEAHRAIAVGLRNGSLRPVVGRELPLVEAPRAHQLILERPALGKIVLVP